MIQPAQLKNRAGKLTDIWRFPVIGGNDLARVYTMPANMQTMDGKTISFDTPEQAQHTSTMAMLILGAGGVKQITFSTSPHDGRDTITVEMKDKDGWTTHGAYVEGRIIEQIAHMQKTGEPLITFSTKDNRQSSLLDKNGQEIGIDSIPIQGGNTLARMYVMPADISCMQDKLVTFKTREQAQSKCLTALRLLGISDIERVVITQDKESKRDTITITMHSEAAWAKHKPNIQGILIQQLESMRKNKTPLVNTDKLKAPKKIDSLIDDFKKAGYSLAESEIRAIISTVNHELAAHGGETNFAGYDKSKQELSVTLHGNCNGCAGSALTVQAGLMRQFNRLSNVMAWPVKKVKILETPRPH